LYQDVREGSHEQLEENLEKQIAKGTSNPCLAGSSYQKDPWMQDDSKYGQACGTIKYFTKTSEKAATGDWRRN